MSSEKLRTFYSKTPNSRHLEEAADVLHNGGMVIFPTDTVYAMGCLSTQSESLSRLA